MATATQNLPVESFRLSGISLGIFENESTHDGQTQKYLKANIDKRYRDNKSGEWRSTSSFSLDDLLRLRAVIDKAVDYMINHAAEERAAEPSLRRNGR